MRRLKCLLGSHAWPEVWTKYGERSLLITDGLWFEVFEKVCPHCGARQTYDGPFRYSRHLGGGISSVNDR